MKVKEKKGRRAHCFLESELGVRFVGEKRKKKEDGEKEESALTESLETVQKKEASLRGKSTRETRLLDRES